MPKALADRLMDLCETHAPQIAEQWYQAVCLNPRTKSFTTMPKQACVRHAISIYHNLGDMFFSDNCCKAVARNLDESGFVEDHFARGIPLEEVVYSLILLRRQIWLYAELQALYGDAQDMSQAAYSINRILLVFDYAIHDVVKRYGEMSSPTTRKPSK
jgi:hypothetical protein